MSHRINQKFKVTAREEVSHVRDLTIDAARSGAYLYPIKGLIYFLSHKGLWKPVTSKIVPNLSLGVGITSFMFIFTYLPQAAIMTFVDGPLAVLSTSLLVLSESATLLNFISKSFVIKESIVDIFDGTLVSKELTGLVSQGRTLKVGPDPMGKLGKLMKNPFDSISPRALIRYFLYLPLNFIPVIGTVLFITLQGKRFGTYAHKRYFQLKGWSSSQQEEWVERYRGAYTSFGVVATLLEMVPVFGIFFSYTNTVGAALWAADLENDGASLPTQKHSKRQ